MAPIVSAIKAPANKLVIKFPNEAVIFYFLLFVIINNKVKNNNINYNRYCSNFLKKNIINIQFLKLKINYIFLLLF